jgi:hypothetical protein
VLKKSKTKAKATRVADARLPPTGTPRGWSFWETAASCWRRWFYRYVLTLMPFVEPEYFAVGSIYHALHEGIDEATIAGWGEQWARLLPEGKRLYEARLKGPPLPKATAVEQTLDVPGLPMTSKPDREEMTFGGRPRPRDFKTSGWFGEHDDKFWAVNGQIIGQMLATHSQKASLDLVHKRSGETKLLEVELTEAKSDALIAMITDLNLQLESRMVGLAQSAKAKGLDLQPKRLVDIHFPPKLSSCVTKYGPCPYYARCWAAPADPAKYMYKESNSRPWLEHETKTFRADVDRVVKLSKGAL